MMMISFVLSPLPPFHSFLYPFCTFRSLYESCLIILAFVKQNIIPSRFITENMASSAKHTHTCTCAQRHKQIQSILNLIHVYMCMHRVYSVNTCIYIHPTFIILMKCIFFIAVNTMRKIPQLQILILAPFLVLCLVSRLSLTFGYWIHNTNKHYYIFVNVSTKILSQKGINLFYGRLPVEIVKRMMRSNTK